MLDLEHLVAGEKDNILPCARIQTRHNHVMIEERRPSMRKGPYGGRSVDTNAELTEIEEHSEADFLEPHGAVFWLGLMRIMHDNEQKNDPGISTIGWTRYQLHQTMSDLNTALTHMEDPLYISAIQDHGGAPKSDPKLFALLESAP